LVLATDGGQHGADVGVGEGLVQVGGPILR
jgi:hypothetical protein